jgi:hypothetical protein
VEEIGEGSGKIQNHRLSSLTPRLVCQTGNLFFGDLTLCLVLQSQNGA